jgi:hypothetical protein
MQKKMFRLLLLLIVFTIFPTCKKYPETTLWFKNPKNLTFIMGELTAYRVNGIDSLNLLDRYAIANSQFPKKNIQSYQTCNTCHNGHSFAFGGELGNGTGSRTFSRGSCEYTSKGKKLKIYNLPDRDYYNKDIFIESGLEWEIVYLSKKNNKRKIKTIYNGNIYEIQFN